MFPRDETWGDFIKDVKQSNVYKYKEAVSRKFRSDRFKNIEELRIKQFFKVEIQYKNFDFEGKKEFNLTVKVRNEDKVFSFEWMPEKSNQERRDRGDRNDRDNRDNRRDRRNPWESKEGDRKNLWDTKDDKDNGDKRKRED